MGWNRLEMRKDRRGLRGPGARGAGIILPLAMFAAGIALLFAAAWSGTPPAGGAVPDGAKAPYVAANLAAAPASDIAAAWSPAGLANADVAGADGIGSADPSLPDQNDPEGSAEAPPDEGLFYVVYRVVRGDTISHIAERYGVSVDAIVTFNDVTNARTLSIGRYLKIPTINGILYRVKAGDSLSSIARAFEISVVRIQETNAYSANGLEEGRKLFLPDARLSSFALREINGDLFTWPLRGWITSWYGWRKDPFTGGRTFHKGIDIGSPEGTAIRAAMEGTVSATGYSAVSGNYVVIAHHSGYTTMYGHLSAIVAKAGQRVTTATVIGKVGSTGYATGDHLHFSISKYGKSVNPMTMLR